MSVTAIPLTFNTLLERLCVGFLRDTEALVLGATQAQPDRILVPKLAGQVANAYAGAEVYFTQPGFGMAAENPMRVVSSGADGVLVLSEAYGATGPDQGQRILVSGRNGQGWPMQAKIIALLMALNELGAMVEGGGGVAYDEAAGGRYLAPSTLDTIHTIEVPTGDGGVVTYHAEAFGPVERQAGTFQLPLSLDAGTIITVRGRAYLDAEQTGNSWRNVVPLTTVNPMEAIRLAIGNLTGTGGSVEEQRVAQRHTRVSYQKPRPGEVFLRR